MSVSLICLGGLEAEDVGGGQSWVGGVVLVSVGQKETKVRS